jgi:Fe-S-cluster containining protein
MNVILDEYRLFLLEVDALCAELAVRHAQHLNCRRGCSGCCTDISVLPVEWSSIREGLSDPAGMIRAAARPASAAPDHLCAFLVDRSCSIYPLRPLICRAHGLPLVYRVESYDAAGNSLETDEWQTCWCGLNFTGLSPTTFVSQHGAEAVLNMENLNRKLLQLNRRYVGSPEGRRFRAGERLELSALLG